MSAQGAIYLVGVILLGISYSPVRAAIGNDILFATAALAYLAWLRLVGYLWERTRRKGQRNRE